MAARHANPEVSGGLEFLASIYQTFMTIATIVLKLCTIKVENSVNAQSAPFCQIWSQNLMVKALSGDQSNVQELLCQYVHMTYTSRSVVSRSRAKIQCSPGIKAKIWY